MKTFLMILGLGISAGMVQAAPLSYVTVGTLACGTAANCSENAGSLVFNSGAATMTITYTPSAVVNLIAQPTATVPYGALQLSCNAACGQAPKNAAAAFDMTGATMVVSILETTPVAPPLTAVFYGSFLNVLTASTNGAGGTTYGGSGMLTFEQSSYTLTSATWKTDYVLDMPRIPIPNIPQYFYPISLNNTTSLQGTATVHMPEPGTLASLGAGLIGLGLLGRRRKK